MIELTPKQLEDQSPVKISKWIDIDSDDARNWDNDRQFTKQLIKLGFEEATMDVDRFGRIYSFSSTDNLYYPLHFEYRKKLIGFRISTKASN